MAAVQRDGGQEERKEERKLMLEGGLSLRRGREMGLEGEKFG